MSESDGTFPLPFQPPDTAIIKADAKPVVITWRLKGGWTP